MISPRTIIGVLILALLASACSWFDNQTTYFNTYYNMDRIMGEIKDEFAYQDENKRVKPRVLVPGLDSAALPTGDPTKPPQYQFLNAFVIERAKLQPVATKVDSILLKGSKILANHPKSNYVEGSLFLMAESYFFRQEWIPSQQKCIELIERFSDGDYSPDAHLLLSKDYLLQKKIAQGKQMLSRTVDVAWYKDRYDILSEAYRIQAELALEEGDLEKAVAPYKQAIAQSENDEIRAQWQVDVASIYYRRGRFDLALAAFEKVGQYSPDLLAQFESRLYHAAALVRLNRLDEAEEEFKALEDNRNYVDWNSYIVAERLALERARTDGNLEDPALIAQERTADTSFIGRPELMAQNFQKAMALYKQHDYTQALTYFAKAKVIRTPVYEVAAKYYTLLKQWEDQHRKVHSFRTMVIERESMRDSVKMMTAREVFNLGRVHEQLGNTDSAIVYYAEAFDSTASSDPERSRYLYSQARLIAETDPDTADSLMFVLNENWPNSPYGKEASSTLGFVSDAVPDDASELYRSGQSFRRIKDYSFAARQFRSIVANHPASPYAPKALYALGWMYERDTPNLDSALYYYGLLIEQYPKSEYAREVFPSVEFALAKRNNVEVSDSTLLRNLDDDLLQRAKAGERDVLQQMLDNNKDALQITGPAGITLPTIPGVNPGGGNLNDMLQNQLKNLKGVVLPPDSTVRDTTAVPKKP